MLENKIRDDLKQSMKNGDKEKTNCLRYLVSEFQRRKNPHEQITDKEIISLINKMIKSEKEVINYSEDKSSRFIEILAEYVPKQMSKDEIYNWIKVNVPDVFNNEPKDRMKFMKNIMSSEISNLVNGNDVKDVLQKY